MTIFTIQLPYSKISQRWLSGPKPVLMSVSLCSSCLLQVPKSISNGRWFEPKGISYLVGVIVQMRVVFRKTVSGDWSFNCLSDSYLQSQGKSRCQMMVCISKLKYSTLRKIVSAELLTTEGNKWEPHKEFTAGRDTIKICSWERGEGGREGKWCTNATYPELNCKWRKSQPVTGISRHNRWNGLSFRSCFNAYRYTDNNESCETETKSFVRKLNWDEKFLLTPCCQVMQLFPWQRSLDRCAVGLFPGLSAGRLL